MRQETLDDALARVEAHADDEWLAAAKDAVWRIALRQDTLTTNDVWDALALLAVGTHDRRAMGPVMKWAARRRYVENTRTWTAQGSHGRPIPVWRSLLREERAA